ncbi:MAG: hypothetical protein JWM06_597 [Actinomycetia bacterium]|nr:hypothetical protein [Actinomycetes bacterium]
MASPQAGALPRYEGEARRCVALPLGGIGTGHVALCGDGALRQWQLHNRPNHLGFLPATFFALRVAGVEPPLDIRRILQSPAVPPAAEPAPNVVDHVVPHDADPPTAHWSPVSSTAFEGAYPFGRLTYQDPALPVDVSLEAYTPFVPLDDEASELPLASFTFTLSNLGATRLHGWILSTLQNAVGWDGATPIHGDACSLYGGNVNRVVARPESTAIVMDNPGLPDDDPRAGELALWTRSPSVPLPRFAGTQDALRFVEALKLLRPTIDDDWSEDAIRRACNELPPLLHVPVGASPPGRTWNGALAAAFSLAPGETTTIEFVTAWRFPNRYVDFDQFGPDTVIGGSRLWLGNHYAKRFGSALDAVDYYAEHRDRLHGQSESWTAAFATSTLPDAVIDTLLAQGSLIRSPTTFRASDGRFFGFEGSLGESTLNWNGSVGGSCPLNCNHVWNYEQAVSRLFPALERSMRETELEVSQAPEGYLPHRVVAPVWLPQLHGRRIGGPDQPALDGMLGAFLKSYREVQQGASQDWLAVQWPRLRRLFQYVDTTWNRGGDGLLLGEQPVTYDIALHGPNMFVGGLWLAALRALEEMANLVEPDAAAQYGDLFRRASERYDALLWNGEYYAQLAAEASHEFGEGCLADQLLGQWWAHQLDLGYILPRERVRGSLQAIIRHNFRRSFRDFEHDYRTFADIDDEGLLVCTWPNGGRPPVPVRYCDEVWTGVEYQVAAHCFIEGLHREGTELLEAVRARYDGTRRNPYNEIECGDHYARAMAGWSLLEAVTGFRYDALQGRMTIVDQPGRYPFVAGTGWGTIEIDANGSLELSCLGGRIELRELKVDRPGESQRLLVQPREVRLEEGERATIPLRL